MTPAQRAAHLRMMRSLPVRTIEARRNFIDFEDRHLHRHDVPGPNEAPSCRDDSAIEVEGIVKKIYKNLRQAAKGLRIPVQQMQNMLILGGARRVVRRDRSPKKAKHAKSPAA